MSALTYTITAVVSTSFGDHGAMMPTSREPIEGETVEEMILRILPSLTQPYQRADPGDHIIIRVTQESIERLRATVVGDETPPF